MTLDGQVCSRARLSRDARFDGKFFIGVDGSGVYCRPICPAPTAKEKNVHYFSTAAAAAEAGYRPCLRCRPEASPATPAWCGTSNTVSRALRLIGETGLEDGGVEALAERLGICSPRPRLLLLKTSGRDSDGGGAYTAAAFCEETDRRDEFADEPGCDCVGIRVRTQI